MCLWGQMSNPIHILRCLDADHLTPLLFVQVLMGMRDMDSFTIQELKLTPGALQAALAGEDHIPLNMWRAATTVSPEAAVQHPVVNWFWEFVLVQLHSNSYFSHLLQVSGIAAVARALRHDVLDDRV